MANKKNTKKKKFRLIPPKSGVEEYESRYDVGLTFVLKIFDFDEDDVYSNMVIKHMEWDENDVMIKDEDGNPVIHSDEYYVELFEFGVVEIKGLTTTEYEPSWKIIKEVVNQIAILNSVKERKKLRHSRH